MQQGAQRRAGGFDAAVGEVAAGHALLRRDNGVDAAGEGFTVLRFRTQDLVRDDVVGRFKDAPQKVVGKQRCDAIAQPAGQHLVAVQLEILELLEVAVLHEEARLALLRRHAAPDLRHQHADVVVHADRGSDMTGRGRKAGVAGEDERDQGVVQIDDRPEGVERALR